MQLLDKKQEEEDEDLDFRALENGFVSVCILPPVISSLLISDLFYYNILLMYECKINPYHRLLSISNYIS